MAVGGGRHVDRLVEAEMGADALGRQPDELRQHLLEPRRGDAVRLGAVQVDIERQRLGDADRIAELDRAAAGEARGDDVLGEVAADIGGRAVDLGRVLAGERAAAVRGRAAIGVDDDLAAGEAGVAVRAADLEQPGRVDEDGVVVIGHPARGQHLGEHALHIVAQLRLVGALGVLGRDDQLHRAHRPPVLISERHLALRVRLEEVGIAIVPEFRRGARGRGANNGSSPASDRRSRRRRSRT